ncbi:MAG: hypothetical protein M3N13_06725, partial [Candidatus Eremiobacteraeota bacterium]|nr:hypothetical protein [Candidatus Eremiobacteraeota bacterium]
ANTNFAAKVKTREIAEAQFVKLAQMTVRARTQLEVAENDEHDDESRAEALKELGLTLLGARDRRDKAAKAVAAFVENPHDAEDALRRRRDGANNERQAASEWHAATKALLEAAMASGPYETLALAETDVFGLRAQLLNAEKEARAAKLLHEIFVAVEADREAAILAPLRKRTSELYARITASNTPELHFNQDLTFGGLDANGVRCLQTLSGGEREQLHMLTRLALADLVTQGERQLVILDDSLPYTDPHRFARFLGLIEEFSRERMQFVIATCDKARYLGLNGAAFIDLASKRRAVAA